MRYTVKITEQATYCVPVFAANADEAEELALELYTRANPTQYLDTLEIIEIEAEIDKEE
jgi:hypothetical protein